MLGYFSELEREADWEVSRGWADSTLTSMRVGFTFHSVFCSRNTPLFDRHHPTDYRAGYLAVLLYCVLRYQGRASATLQPIRRTLGGENLSPFQLENALVLHSGLR